MSELGNWEQVRPCASVRNAGLHLRSQSRGLKEDFKRIWQARYRKNVTDLTRIFILKKRLGRNQHSPLKDQHCRLCVEPQEIR